QVSGAGHGRARPATADGAHSGCGHPRAALARPAGRAGGCGAGPDPAAGRGGKSPPPRPPRPRSGDTKGRGSRGPRGGPGPGVALAAYRGDDVAAAADALGRSRPTAVNLSWGAARALAAYRAARDAEPGDTAPGRRRAAAAALAQARAIEAADAAASAAIAGH